MSSQLPNRMSESAKPAPPTDRSITERIASAFAEHARHRLPKYLSLQAALRDSVIQGHLRPGTRLPAEDQLAQQVGVSLGTVQKAMAVLQRDGLLERRQGDGTYVSDPSFEEHQSWHFRFLADDGQSYLPLRALAISKRIVSGAGPWASYMPGASPWLQVRRRIEVGSEFCLLSDFYFDGRRFASLTDLPLAAFSRVVLRNLLYETFHLRAAPARQHLRMMPFPPAICRALGLAPERAGMLLEVFGRDIEQHPIYYQRVWIPQNDRVLRLHD